MATAISSQIDRKSLFSRYFVETFPPRLVKSFIANFGWLSLQPPYWIYALYLLLVAGAVLGIGYQLRRRAADARLLLVLLAVVVCNLVTVVYINLTLSQPQGRFMFPSLAAIVTLSAIGLEQLPGWSGRATAYIVAALAIVNVAILGILIIPAYWPPP